MNEFSSNNNWYARHMQSNRKDSWTLNIEQFLLLVDESYGFSSIFIIIHTVVRIRLFILLVFKMSRFFRKYVCLIIPFSSSQFASVADIFARENEMYRKNVY